MTEIKFLTLKHPQVPRLGHDPGDTMKILFNMYYISSLWEHTHNLVKKTFENDFVFET